MKTTQQAQIREHVQLSHEARKVMAIGVNKLAKVVGTTLGPDGKLVFYERPLPLGPHSTKDGVSVATLTRFSEPLENMGAEIVKYAAKKTAQEAGDGTTTSTILANYMIQEGLKLVDQGVNTRHLGAGIMKGANRVAELLKHYGISIDNKSEFIKSIAMVSSNYDEEISEMIAEVIGKTGNDWSIQIKQAVGTQTKMTYVDGTYIESGMLHPEFITNYERGITEFKNVAFVIADYEISQFDELAQPIFALMPNHTLSRKKDYNNEGEVPYLNHRVDAILFISKAIIGEALSSLVKSVATKSQPFVAVKPPWSNDLNDILEDLAVVTGGHVVAESKGFSLKEGNPHQYCGWAKSITVTQQGLTIVGGEGSQKAIDDRIEYLKMKQRETDNQTFKEEYQERIARMRNSIAQITVGGDNESVMKEKAFRVEDAREAVKSGLEEGIITGGGISFLRAMVDLEKFRSDIPDEQKGIDIVRKSLEVPIKLILENSGYSPLEARYIIDEIRGETGLIHKIRKYLSNIHETIPANAGPDVGFNARTKKFEDLFDAGVIEPVKVGRFAVQQAATVTQQFLNTGASITLMEYDEPRERGR